MPSPDENKILRFMGEEDGQSSIVAVARMMGVRVDYARSICESIGRRDFIDVLGSGKLGLTEKGWSAVGKKGRGGIFQEDPWWNPRRETSAAEEESKGETEEKPENEYAPWVPLKSFEPKIGLRSDPLLGWAAGEEPERKPRKEKRRRFSTPRIQRIIEDSRLRKISTKDSRANPRRRRVRATKPYTPVGLKPYTPKPLNPYKPVPIKPYRPVPIKSYTPTPKKAYTPVPIKPYTPKPIKEYTPKPSGPSRKRSKGLPPPGPESREECPHCGEMITLKTDGRKMYCKYCRNKVQYVAG